MPLKQISAFSGRRCEGNNYFKGTSAKKCIYMYPCTCKWICSKNVCCRSLALTSFALIPLRQHSHFAHRYHSQISPVLELIVSGTNESRSAARLLPSCFNIVYNSKTVASGSLSPHWIRSLSVASSGNLFKSCTKSKENPINPASCSQLLSNGLFKSTASLYITSSGSFLTFKPLAYEKEYKLN